MSGYRGAEEGRYQGYQAVEGAGEAILLLKEEAHGSEGNGPVPQQEEAVAEGGQLHHHAHQGQEDIGLYGEKIVFHPDIPPFFLPAAKALPVNVCGIKGLYRINMIEGLHLEGHQPTGGLLDLFGIFPLSAHHSSGGQKKEGQTSQGKEGHYLVIVKDHAESCAETIEGENHGGKPADCVAAYRLHIVVEAVQKIAVAILAQGHPIRIHHPGKYLPLDLIADIDGQPGSDAADDIFKEKT